VTRRWREKDSNPRSPASRTTVSRRHVRGLRTFAAPRQGDENLNPELSAAEREELARLRREIKQLRLERDILSRAAAWFARETGAIPPGSSNS
jgi:transposase-like protein